MYHAINIFFCKEFVTRAPQSCYSAILYFSESVPIQVYIEHWRCLSFYVMMPIWPYAFYLDSIELRFTSIAQNIITFLKGFAKGIYFRENLLCSIRYRVLPIK